MTKIINLLKNKHSLLLYLEGSYKSVLLYPYPQQSAIWYKLYNQLKKSSHTNPFLLSQFHQSTEGLQNMPFIPTNKGLNVYLTRTGKLREGGPSTEQQEFLMQVGIASSGIGDRKIIGIQQRWQYLLALICQILIFFSITSCYRTLRYDSRTQNHEKLKQIMKLSIDEIVVGKLKIQSK